MTVRFRPRVALNRYHPAAPRCQILAVPNGNNLMDLVTKKLGTITGSPTAARSNFIGNTTNTDILGAFIGWTGRPTPTYDRWTYAALIKPTTSSGIIDILAEELSGSTSTAIAYTGTTNTFTFKKGGINFSLASSVGGIGDVFFVAGSGSYSAQNKFSLVIRCLTAGNKIDSTVGSFSTFPPTALGGFRVGITASGRFPGQIGWAMFSYSAMTLNELIAWASDPDSIFAEDQPDWLSRYSLAAAGGTTQNITMSTAALVFAGFPLGVNAKSQIVASQALLKFNAFILPVNAKSQITASQALLKFNGFPLGVNAKTMVTMSMAPLIFAGNVLTVTGAVLIVMAQATIVFAARVLNFLGNAVNRMLALLGVGS